MLRLIKSEDTYGIFDCLNIEKLKSAINEMDRLLEQFSKDMIEIEHDRDD